MEATVNQSYMTLIEQPGEEKLLILNQKVFSSYAADKASSCLMYIFFIFQNGSH